MKFKVCYLCGASLDHGEQCDCEREAELMDDQEARRPIKSRVLNYEQLYMRFLGIDKEVYCR